MEAVDLKSGKCSVCENITTTRCSACSQVFYCSTAHQQSDWKSHKKNCRPFKITSDEKYGRYIVASKNIKSGDVILKESPIIRGPPQLTGPVCVGCLDGLEENDRLQCEKCGWPICSKECGNSSDHKNECELTVARGSKVSIQSFVSPHPTYQCLTVIRCLMLKEKSPAKWKRLMELESHCTERRGSDQWRIERAGVAKFIPRFFKCESKWTEDEILKITGILQVNAHEVPLSNPPYVAIFDFASFAEHSCRPNMTKSFSDKGEIIFWAPYDIKKGARLSICYTDSLWGTANRQNHLLQTKMFKCDCVRCTDVTEFQTFYSSIKCPNKIDNVQCDGLMLPSELSTMEENWICRKCSHQVENNYVKNILERAGKDIVAMQKESKEHCVKYLEHYSKWLPESHFHMCDVKLALVQLIGAGGPQKIQQISEDTLCEKIKIGHDLLKIFSIISPAESRLLGMIRFELHAGFAELGRRWAAQSNSNFKGVLEESILNAEEAVRLLSKESKSLAEGQICNQAKVNVESLKIMLGMQTCNMDL